MRTEALPLERSAQERARGYGLQVESLQRLIDACEDGYRGLEAAAANFTQAPQLTALLRNYARQRCAFSRELQGLIRVLGGRPRVQGAAAGALRRGWLSLRSLFDGDDGALLATCVEEEQAALNIYDEVLATPFPAAVRDAVARQRDEIEKIHGYVASLRPNH